MFSIPTDVSAFPDTSSKFRAHLLLGRQNPVALRYFFSIPPNFSARLFMEQVAPPSAPRELVLCTVDFSNLTKNPLSPKIFLKYHKECSSVFIASKTWQRQLIKDIADVWGRDTDDLDPLALALLAREGKIPSVFSVGLSTYSE